MAGALEINLSVPTVYVYNSSDTAIGMTRSIYNSVIVRLVHAACTFASIWLNGQQKRVVELRKQEQQQKSQIYTGGKEKEKPVNPKTM